MQFIPRLLLVSAVLMAPWVSLAAQAPKRSCPQLTAIEIEFDEKVKEMGIQTGYDISVHRENLNYIAQLDRALETAQQAGKLDDTLALQAERESVALGKGVPTEYDPATPAVLKELRASHLTEIGRIEDKRTGELKPLQAAFKGSVDALFTRLTNENRLQEADAVTEERDTLGAATPVPQRAGLAPVVPFVGLAKPKARQRRLTAAQLTVGLWDYQHPFDGPDPINPRSGRADLSGVDYVSADGGWTFHNDGTLSNSRDAKGTWYIKAYDTLRIDFPAIKFWAEFIPSPEWAQRNFMLLEINSSAGRRPSCYLLQAPDKRPPNQSPPVYQTAKISKDKLTATPWIFDGPYLGFTVKWSFHADRTATIGDRLKGVWSIKHDDHDNDILRVDIKSEGKPWSEFYAEPTATEFTLYEHSSSEGKRIATLTVLEIDLRAEMIAQARKEARLPIPDAVTLAEVMGGDSPGAHAFFIKLPSTTALVVCTASHKIDEVRLKGNSVQVGKLLRRPQIGYLQGRGAWVWEATPPAGTIPLLRPKATLPLMGGRDLLILTSDGPRKAQIGPDQRSESIIFPGQSLPGMMSVVPESNGFTSIKVGDPIVHGPSGIVIGGVAVVYDEPESAKRPNSCLMALLTFPEPPEKLKAPLTQVWGLPVVAKPSLDDQFVQKILPVRALSLKLGESVEDVWKRNPFITHWDRASMQQDVFGEGWAFWDHTITSPYHMINEVYYHHSNLTPEQVSLLTTWLIQKFGDPIQLDLTKDKTEFRVMWKHPAAWVTLCSGGDTSSPTMTTLLRISMEREGGMQSNFDMSRYTEPVTASRANLLQIMRARAMEVKKAKPLDDGASLFRKSPSK